MQHLNAEQAYELQVSNLTRSVGNLEEAMRQTEEDKQNLLEDLTAVRELCAKLEATKESIQRQLTSTSLDKEQVSAFVNWVISLKYHHTGFMLNIRIYYLYYEFSHGILVQLIKVNL